MGEYCNFHLAQGVKDHSVIAYKGQVLVIPVPKDPAYEHCNGRLPKGKECRRKAVWQTISYADRDRMVWEGVKDGVVEQ